jgi:hypothetical protein
VASTATTTAEDAAMLGAVLGQADGVDEERSAAGEGKAEDEGSHDRWRVAGIHLTFSTKTLFLSI